MNEKEEKTRITLTINKELDEKIEKLAKYMNTSKNSVIITLISTTIDMQMNLWSMMKEPTGLRKMFDIASKFGNKEEKEQAKEVYDVLSGEGEEKDKLLNVVEDVFGKEDK